MTDNNYNYKQRAVSSELPVRLWVQFKDRLLEKTMFTVYENEVTRKNFCFVH